MIMNEEIRKNEINEEELERVSGGNNATCKDDKLENNINKNETMLSIPVV